MVRNHNPFTARQLRFIAAIRETLTEISDPENPFISEHFEWRCQTTNNFGKTVKIHFQPFSSRTKAEIVDKAGLIHPNQEAATDQLRAKYGLKKDQFTKARLFESEWNNLIHKAKRAVKTIAYLNMMFAEDGENIAEPIKIMQDIALAELSLAPIKKAIHPPKTAKTAEKRHHKPYNQILAELK